MPCPYGHKKGDGRKATAKALHYAQSSENEKWWGVPARQKA